MKIITILITGMFILSSAVSNAQENTQESKWQKINNEAFFPGEKFEYQVALGLIDVGQGTMEVKEVVDFGSFKAYHLFSTLTSNSFCDKVYKIRNSEESWIEKDSLCSLKYIKHHNENNKPEDKIIEFDHSSGTFLFTEINLRDNTVSRKEGGKIPDFILDELSAFYYIRILPLEVGKEFNFISQSNEKNYPLKIVVKKKEKIKVPYGKFNCFAVEAFSVEKGKESDSKNKLCIWMTDDTRKMPILVKMQSGIGAIAMKLKNLTK